MESGSRGVGAPEVGTFVITASQTQGYETAWDPSSSPQAGSDFVFIVTRSGDVSGAATVDYTLSGLGLSAADFILIGPSDSFPSGSLSFDPGQTEYVLVFKTLRDGLVEGNETLTITLSNPSAGFGLTGAVAQSLILDDDSPAIYGTAGGDSLSDVVAVQSVGPPETRSARIFGLDGNDTLAGQGGGDSLYGGSGDDVLVGGETFFIYNSRFDNRYTGYDELLDGGSGFDIADYRGHIGEYSYFDPDQGFVRYQAGVTVNLAISGPQATGSGSDTLISIEGVWGSAYDDVLTGDSRANLLSGFGGADTLDGGAGRDTLIGGAGNDLYRVDNSQDVIVEAYGSGLDTVIASTSYGLAAGVSVETLQAAAGAAALNLTGNDYAQTLIGNAGINTLDGKGGADTLIGGLGNDTYVVDNAGDVIIENAGEGYDTVRTAGPNHMLGANLEVLTFTGTGGFKGTGNDLANVITGGAGIDLLDGGLGADRLIGGLGNDTYVVDNLADVVVENANEGFDLVKTAIGAFVLSANVENLTYTGAGNFQGFGNGLANVITGGVGNDSLDGKAGADRLTGGLGDDVYFTDNLGDVVIEAAGEGVDRVLTTLNSAVTAANVEGLIFIGAGNFQGFANAAGSAVVGGAGNDTLFGGAGADVLSGRGGNDLLVGNGGADLFNFDAPGQGVDRIGDFQVGVDHIALRGAAFGVVTAADLGFASFNGFGWVIPWPPTDKPSLIYDTVSGALLFDADGNGTGGAVELAVLTGRPALTAADFLIV